MNANKHELDKTTLLSRPSLPLPARLSGRTPRSPSVADFLNVPHPTEPDFRIATWPRVLTMSKTTAARACSIADTLQVVGERWTLLVVRELLHGAHRFDQIVRNTGASRDILTVRLRKLEASGIVRREPYSAHPPRWEYHLTTPGRELGDVLLTLMRWGDRHLNPEEPPVRWQHSCGQTLAPVLLCQHCGEPASEGAHSPTGPGADRATD